MANSPRQAARSTAIITALIVGALLVVGALFGATATITGILGDTWNGKADLLTGSAPLVAVDGSLPDAGSDVAPETNGVAYSGALVTIGGGLLLVLLAMRTLRTRPFARILTWGMGLVGLVAILTATVAPQLEAAAVSIGIRDLGYALYDETHDGSFIAGGPDALALPLWDPMWIIDRIDPVLLMMGITLAVLGLLISDAVRMQRDTEGLV